MRAAFLILVSLVLLEMGARAATLRITTACTFDEMTITSNNVSKTEITFRYGDLAFQMPKPTGWVENPMLLRPQLLIWRYPPLSMPSTIHIEFMGTTTRANASEHMVVATSTGGGGGRYTSPDWTRAVLYDGGTTDESHHGFARTATIEEGYREEVHFVEGPEGVELKLRLLLSPKLDPKAEAAMRGALSEIKILSGKRAMASGTGTVSSER